MAYYDGSQSINKSICDRVRQHLASTRTMGSADWAGILVLSPIKRNGAMMRPIAVIWADWRSAYITDLQSLLCGNPQRHFAERERVCSHEWIDEDWQKLKEQHNIRIHEHQQERVYPSKLWWISTNSQLWNYIAPGQVHAHIQYFPHNASHITWLGLRQRIEFTECGKGMCVRVCVSAQDICLMETLWFARGPSGYATLIWVSVSEWVSTTNMIHICRNERVHACAECVWYDCDLAQKGWQNQNYPFGIRTRWCGNKSSLMHAGIGKCEPPQFLCWANMYVTFMCVHFHRCHPTHGHRKHARALAD